jgi:D-3-phosphoglycerate dehydrogenase
MKILISDKLEEEAIKIFYEKDFDVVKNFTISAEELKKEIKNYHGIIIRSRTKLTADILENAKELKVIGRAGVGLDNVDIKKAEQLKIKVLNTPEAPSVSVAEFTIGLIISLMRHITKADKTMHCGQWCKNDYMGAELRGKNVGIIGFGNIGQAVAKRLEAFETQIGVYDIDPNILEKAKKFSYKIYPSIEELAKNAQIILLHVPANAKTQNMINEKIIKLMRKDALVVNTARGNLIDEKALLAALKNKQIGGAALDVYREEPLKDLDICNCEDNLILTPHIGSQTEETQTQASIMIVEKVMEYLTNST